MRFFLVLLRIFLFMVVPYYLMVMVHVFVPIFGDVKFSKLLIPFYGWGWLLKRKQ